MLSNDIAVSVRGLSKSYLISHDTNRPTTFREAIVERVKHPLRVKAQQRETFWALDDLNFDIRKGESVGIVGRNGAGKSTLLKVLSRITYPSKGVFDVYGRVASLLEVGTGFHGELTGRENIFLNGSILGMSRREIKKKFDYIVAFADVENFLDTPVKRYSSGMYVRLAFAVAAHLHPEILIVDEVLAVGDFAFQKKCLGKMQEVCGEGRTVLFVSHNMATVVQLCNRALLLRRGQLAFDGPPESVVHAYLTEGQSEQEDTLDLSNFRRPAPLNGRARIVSARLVSEERAGAWSIPYGSFLALEVEAVVYREIPEIEFGIALCNASGAEFASPMSRDVEAPAALEPGQYIINLSLPTLKLSTGSYNLDLGLRSDRGMEDHILQAIQFEVLPTSESAEALIHHRRGQVIPEISFSMRSRQSRRDFQSAERASRGALVVGR
jgi:lipopolysaccharide transport system ATP-binding protein